MPVCHLPSTTKRRLVSPPVPSQDPAEVCIELPWCVGQRRMQQGVSRMQHIQEQEKLPQTIGPLCRCGMGLPSMERP